MEIFKATEASKGLFLAYLDIEEAAYFKQLTARIEAYLKANVSASTGTVIDVLPHPNQYFSKSTRFLVLRVHGNVQRDNSTGLFNSFIPHLAGVFLDDEGNAIQPPKKQADRLPEGTYWLEDLTLPEDPKAAIGNRSENQLHFINLPNS